MAAYIAGPQKTESIFSHWATAFGYPDLPHILTVNATDTFILTLAIIILAIYIFAVWICPLRRRSEFPVSVSPTRIANYLLNESAWGRKSLSRLNYIEAVHFGIPDEMTRAARDGDIIFTGAKPNEHKTEIIDRTYWKSFQIDRDRVWDQRNNTFTCDVGHRPFGMSTMEHGAASREDVLRAWPMATLCQRLRPVIWIRIKKFWWALKSSFSCHQN